VNVMFSECRGIAGEFGGDVTGFLIAEDFQVARRTSAT
jgi:hypothetical protein